jgi:hypothetical protein
VVLAASFGQQPGQLPELVLDKVNDSLCIVRPIAGQGADAMARAHARLLSEASDTQRFVNGRAVSADLSSSEDRAATKLLKSLVTRLPAKKVGPETSVHVVAQALSSELQVSVWLCTLAKDGTVVTDRILLPATAKEAKANSSVPSSDEVRMKSSWTACRVNCS